MAKAKRKELHVEETQITAIPDAAVEAPKGRKVRVALPQASVIRTHAFVTVSVDGTKEDVTAVALVTGADMLNIGRASYGLACNVLNGVFSQEIRDTSSTVWKNVPNSLKYGFRKLRDFLDTGKVGKTQVSFGDDNKDVQSRAAYLRKEWEKLAAEKMAKQAKAKDDNKKANYRIRELSISALGKLIKGAAPKGGGIAGLRGKIMARVTALETAIKSGVVANITKMLKELKAEVHGE